MRPLSPSARLALVLAAAAVALGVLAAGLRPDAFFVGDQGVKLIAARNALRSPTHPFEIALPRIGPDPRPHVEPFFAVHSDHAHAVTSELFPVMTAPLLWAMGLRGLYVWPALGLVATLGAAAWFARVLDRTRHADLVALVCALGTPLLFYGLEFWEHTTAVAAATAGAALLAGCARPERRDGEAPIRAFAGGLAFGLATLLRPEAALFALAFVASTRALPSRPSWRVLLVAGAGAALVLVPNALYALLHFGTFMPPHLQANAGLVEESWAQGRLDLAASWLVPSAWSQDEPANPANLWSVTPAAVIAVVGALRPTRRDGRTLLWVTAAAYSLLVFLAAPNDGGGQWGPRYLLFACVPLAILASDTIEDLVAAARRSRSHGAPARAAAIALLGMVVLGALWTQRAGYRHLRGAKESYGRVVDFVRASLSADRQVVTDVWWLDQAAAAALEGQNLLYAGEEMTARAIVRGLSDLTVPAVTVFRSGAHGAAVDGWSAGTCYFEEARDRSPVGDLVAIRLRHRCGYQP